VDFKNMFPGEDYALALGSLHVRVTLLRTSADLQAAERALVRFRQGSRKGESGEVSIHDILYHWKTGKPFASPLPMPRPKPPGVRRQAA
jgi:hypothetical protein